MADNHRLHSQASHCSIPGYGLVIPGAWAINALGNVLNLKPYNNIEEMSLVAHEEIEESVTIDDIIAKARDAYYENLYALAARKRPKSGKSCILPNNGPYGR